MNCFSHFSVVYLQFTHPVVIVCFEVFHCEIHGMVPLLQINILPFIVYGNGDGDAYSCMRGRMGTGTILKLVAGIGVGMGIRVQGTVGDLSHAALYNCPLTSSL